MAAASAAPALFLPKIVKPKWKPKLKNSQIAPIPTELQLENYEIVTDPETGLSLAMANYFEVNTKTRQRVSQVCYGTGRILGPLSVTQLAAVTQLVSLTKPPNLP